MILNRISKKYYFIIAGITIAFLVSPIGQFYIASSLHGLGEFNLAYKLYKLSAGWGYAESNHYLGSMNLHGQGRPQNSQLAIKYFQEATKASYAGSAFSIAMIYLKGDSEVQRDNLRAYYWFKVYECLTGKDEIAFLYAIEKEDPTIKSKVKKYGISCAAINNGDGFSENTFMRWSQNF